MTQRAKLTGSGVPPLAAITIGGGVTSNITATGTTQGTAQLVTDDVNVVTTTGSGAGVILRGDLGQGDSQDVVNIGSNGLAVYPPTGGKINNGTLNASITLNQNKAGTFRTWDGSNFYYTVTS